MHVYACLWISIFNILCANMHILHGSTGRIPKKQTRKKSCHLPQPKALTCCAGGVVGRWTETVGVDTVGALSQRDHMH